MASEIPGPAVAFGDALRLFHKGTLTSRDVVSRIAQYVAAGAPSGELLDVLRRSEIVDRLPRKVHEAVMAALLEPKKGADGAVEAAVPPPEAPTIILEERESGSESEASAAETTSYTPATVGHVLRERFELTELLGEGGMSRVYKAIDLRPDMAGLSTPYIAVKVLTRPLYEQSDSFRALQQEIAKLRRLTHPNIVQMLECDRDGPTVFITMEYLVGDSLYGRLRRGDPTGRVPQGIGRDAARSIITAVADALEYAHQNQVVHGDLKPGNVIVTDRDQIKVIDFGIANWIAPKTAMERREAAQSQGASAVTPRYASPQLMARQRPEAADDVYALACLAYEILTGSHPFDDGVGAKTLRFPPPLRAELTSSQYAALVKALQFERRNRTPTVRQFMEEFNSTERGAKRRQRSLWFSAAVLLAMAGGFYGLPLLKRTAPSPPTVAAPALLPVPAALPTQPAIAAVAPGTGIRDCPTCPQLTVLPVGRFKQGSADGVSSAHEKPQHEVAINYSLAISTNDITVGDFRQFVTATRRDMQGCDTYNGEWRHRPNASWTDPGFSQNETHPVTCVSWNDAAAYAAWLSRKSGHRYRLPSASEWEYAARAGGEAVHPWGASGAAACAYANVADRSAERRYPGWDVFACDDGYANTAPVGSFQANAFGLNDMLGNVFEWTADCWNEDYTKAPTDGSARADGDCRERELRGGSWFSSPSYVTTSHRNHFATDYRTSSVGFRVLREIVP